MRRRVLINWGLSSFFGWGVYGLNLALAWASDPQIAPLTLIPVDRADLAVDPLRMAALEPVISGSSALFAERLAAAAPPVFDVPVLVPLGHDLGASESRANTALRGAPTIGIVFFENTQFSAEAIDCGTSLPVIVTGSTWNERILREYGLTNVRTVLQGVDTTLFHPAPAANLMSDRFKVFSGGKLELRKGQDIVVEAFKRFARSHPDAMLVSAWHSPWAHLARTLDLSGRAAPVVFQENGELDAGAWVAANDIPSHQFVDLGRVANAFLPQVLREMDVALFTNRSEGGTNLVAMECMACGVPTILPANTGHLDLIDDDCCFPLYLQRSVPSIGSGVGQTPGWGDSDVEEVIETLERSYRDRDDRARRGAGGAAKLASLSWARTAQELKAIVLSLED